MGGRVRAGFVANVMAQLLLVAGCGGPAPDSYETVDTRFVELADFGATVPSVCEPVGTIRVPARDVTFLARLTGQHVEAFYTEFVARVGPTGANLVVPTGDHPFHHAAESGLEFLGEAYLCPAEPAA